MLTHRPFWTGLINKIQKKIPVPANEHPGQKKVLIIEDNVSFLKMIKVRLESAGYTVYIAADGLQGYRVAKLRNPDLILLDLMLPLMDGHKVCRLLKNDKTLQNIPVAIFTSRDNEEAAEMTRQGGADAFLLKTTHSGVIIQIIEKLINESS